MTTAIEVEGLTKSFGATEALKGIDLSVPVGSVLGLLGPNGAGKTTAVRILTTLLRPDAGTAHVLGRDVVTQAKELRHLIGLAGQYAAVDEALTGLENLRLVGRLYHLARDVREHRAKELLERFDLTHAENRPVRTYSGGMRRRLDLAASLVNQPEVLFMDEPTSGLDPRSRLDLWTVIRGLVADGTTLLLTTQYLEEADQLANRISVIDHGRVIAEGTANELKARVGGDVLRLALAHPDDTELAAETLSKLAAGDIRIEGLDVLVPMKSTDGEVAHAIRILDAAGIAVVDLEKRRPTLDDVFLSLTGRPAEEEPAEAAS